MAAHLNPCLSVKPFRSATDSYVAYEWIDGCNVILSQALECSGTAMALESDPITRLNLDTSLESH